MTSPEESEQKAQKAEPEPQPDPAPPADREWISTERVRGSEPPPAREFADVERDE